MKKKEVIILASIVGVLLIALIVVAVTLNKGKKDDEAVVPETEKKTEQTTTVTEAPKVEEYPDHTEDCAYNFSWENIDGAVIIKTADAIPSGAEWSAEISGDECLKAEALAPDVNGGKTTYSFRVTSSEEGIGVVKLILKDSVGELFRAEISVSAVKEANGSVETGVTNFSSRSSVSEESGSERIIYSDAESSNTYQLTMKKDGSVEVYINTYDKSFKSVYNGDALSISEPADVGGAQIFVVKGIPATERKIKMQDGTVKTAAEVDGEASGYAGVDFVSDDSENGSISLRFSYDADGKLEITYYK